MQALLRGRARWTLELLADAMVNLTRHESLSGETVHRLAENDLKPWRKDMWCIPGGDGRLCRPHGQRIATFDRGPHTGP